MKQALLIAGGKGTRLKQVLGDAPKILAPIGGRPLVDHLLELLRLNGWTDVLFLLGCQAQAIQRHVGDTNRSGLNVRFAVEENPLGTAGAVLSAFPQLAERFLVLYGDEMVHMDLDRLWQAHASKAADATLVLHPNDHPLDSDLVEVDAQDWITGFHGRPHPPEAVFQNLVNAALYILERRPLESWQSRAAGMDFGRDIFPQMLRAGARLWGYRSPEYVKDIGTPERYRSVCAEYAAGVVARSSLAVPQAAVFLDRDGTLNTEVGGVTRADQLELLPGVTGAIHRLNHSGVRAVLITNQPVVAKGFCTEAELQLIHNKLETLLGREHAYLDRIYVCPHHPDRGFAGERADLKISCDCRKPGIGLIQQAARDLNLDLSRCFLVGDSTTDLETARRAGVRSVLVQTGYAGKDGKFAVAPDLVCDSLEDAAGRILELRQ